MLALIFVSNPNTCCRIAIGTWFAFSFAFLAIGFVVVCNNTSTKFSVTNSNLAVVVEFVIDSPFSALSINSTRNCALRISGAENVAASSCCCIARINSTKDIIVTCSISNLASARIQSLNQCCGLAFALSYAWRTALWRMVAVCTCYCFLSASVLCSIARNGEASSQL
jgi:hypothetical protein